nr:ribonuclease H-like domain-containing protein [Tanacetum cinerariifolium]
MLWEGDRFQPSGGYHVVSPSYTGTFTPPKPDLVFNTAPIAVETDHLAFNVQLKNESEPKAPQFVPSFAQSSEHVKSLRHSDQPIKTTIRAATPVPASPKTHSSGKRRNMKACFVCKRTFTPPKPDLVFNTAPIAVETDHLAFNVQLKNESEPKAPQFVPSFAQSSKHVKSLRHSDQPIETTIRAATPVPASPKTHSSGKRRNMKACFVCKSVDHLIKKIVIFILGNWLSPHKGPMLTGSKLIFNTAVRPVNAALPNITVTRLRYAHHVVTKSKSPIRRHITHSPSSKTSTSPPRATVVKAPVVSVAQGKQGTWIQVSNSLGPKKNLTIHIYVQGNPQQVLKDKGVIVSGCSRHMTGNMSYLFEFEELNGGYVAFGGNLKDGKITGKGKIKIDKLDFDDVYFVEELKFNLFSVSQICDKKNHVLFTDTECLVLSSDFKLPDESHVLLRVPRENNMYNDKTSPILMTFITGLENQLSLTVKVIRSDNGTKLKNSNLNQFCRLKGIKREFTVLRTPQQNGIAERKIRTLIEAARTMLADSLLPIPFWAEAVNTTCYVQNRVLVTKSHNKNPYELLHGRTPSIGFMRPFGCHVTILNTLDP